MIVLLEYMGLVGVNSVRVVCAVLLYCCVYDVCTAVGVCGLGECQQCL